MLHLSAAPKKVRCLDGSNCERSLRELGEVKTAIGDGQSARKPRHVIKEGCFHEFWQGDLVEYLHWFGKLRSLHELVTVSLSDLDRMTPAANEALQILNTEVQYLKHG